MAVAADDKQITAADFKNLKVALIHYWFVTWRGGEKVVEAILKLFPRADIYTLFYDPAVCGPYLKGHRVYSSILDHPPLKSMHQKIFPLYPLGIRSLHLQDDYDLIISSESGPAKGIANPKKTPHLCYVHTPMRYCWGFEDQYTENLPAGIREVTRWQLRRLKRWDLTTVAGVDRYLANSQNVAKRVQRFYERDAGVVYPPIALDLFANPLERQTEDFYLSFGAITPYKNIDLLVDTFNQNGKKLIVIGDGSERQRLQQKARPNIEFKGSLPWPEIRLLISQAKALLFPGEEDFGMIPLEVMSQGLPVIALKKGGALETVVEQPGQPAQSSGLFFAENTPSALNQALERFEKMEQSFDPQWIRQHARSFGEDVFQNNIIREILALLNSSQP